jgi:UDP-N-acetylglucosamine transferase subunit ALG13
LIFAMVGMHTSGFDRLVRALDEYAGLRAPVDMTIQLGHGRYRPANARWFEFKDSLGEDLAAADLVVSQGSVGFFDALGLGRRLVVVPRQARFGEAMDDHQIGFSQGFSRRYGFPVVLDVADLGAALDRVRAGPPPDPIPIGSPTGLHRDLRAYLAGCAKAGANRPRG